MAKTEEIITTCRLSVWAD